MVGDTCNHEVFGLVAARKLSAAPLLAKFTVALVPVYGCVVSTRGLGLISSVCAPSPYAHTKSSERCRKETPPDAGCPTRRETPRPLFALALEGPLFNVRNSRLGWNRDREG